MKFAGILLAALVFSSFAAQAQGTSQGALLFAPASPAVIGLAAPGTLSPVLRAALASARPAAAMPSPAPAPQGVYGVFPDLYWQVYLGYSYMRLYEVPGTIANLNGVEGSMAYYFKPWAAAEAEVDGGVGSQGGQTAKYAFGGGGVRLRWSAPRALEAWIHGVAGGAHFVPKTPYGGEGAFGYELGGGIDLKAHHEHFAYRVEADLVGTTFFGTYQISPKVSAGLVYKF